MKAFYTILWAVYVIALIFDLILAVYNHIIGDTVEATYYLLWIVVLILCYNK